MSRAIHYLAVGLIAATSLGAGGCCDKLKRERDELYQQNLQLQDELTRSKNDLASCEAERNKLLSQVGELEAENAKLKEKPPAPPVTAGQSGANFSGEGVSVSETASQITVRVAGDILFDSGRNTLKTAAKRTLDGIARVLNSQYPNNLVRIEGHTDSDPIRKSKWRDNYELSEARAIAVRDYLVSRGVARNRLMIVGHGPDKPVASNATAAGKARNRRVEIIVVK